MKKNLILIATLTVILVGCASIDPNMVTRPSNTSAHSGDRAELVSAGEALWKDPSIGKSGLSCQSCHTGGAQFKDSFKQAYPHKVNMAVNMSKLNSVDAEQMVQFCMMAPMKTQPFAWDSKELAALTAYVEDVEQKKFQEK